MTFDLQHLLRLRAQAEVFLKQVQARRFREASQGNSDFFVKTGQQTILKGLTEFLLSGDIVEPVSSLRHGVNHLMTALELNWELSSRELRDLFLAALATSDVSTAFDIASCPVFLKFNPGAVTVQALTLFALLRNDDEHVSRELDLLYGFSFERRESGDPQEPLEYCQWLYYCLEALHRRDSSAMELRLWQRLEFPEAMEAANSSVCPTSPINLNLLGLAGLAKLRGMHVAVRHPNFPLAFLE
jgi:hypothetical protein